MHNPKKEKTSLQILPLKGIPQLKEKGRGGTHLIIPSGQSEEGKKICRINHYFYIYEILNWQGRCTKKNNMKNASRLSVPFRVTDGKRKRGKGEGLLKFFSGRPTKKKSGGGGKKKEGPCALLTLGASFRGKGKRNMSMTSCQPRWMGERG